MQPDVSLSAAEPGITAMQSQYQLQYSFFTSQGVLQGFIHLQETQWITILGRSAEVCTCIMIDVRNAEDNNRTVQHGSCSFGRGGTISTPGEKPSLRTCTVEYCLPIFPCTKHSAYFLEIQSCFHSFLHRA
jgi:hypothetical protein